jgi:hypothetical protein
MEHRDKNDKSISSLASFPSRKSSTQIVGFISKPKDRVYTGMIVDYLVQPSINKE